MNKKLLELVKSGFFPCVHWVDTIPAKATIIEIRIDIKSHINYCSLCDIFDDHLTIDKL